MGVVGGMVASCSFLIVFVQHYCLFIIPAVLLSTPCAKAMIPSIHYIHPSIHYIHPTSPTPTNTQQTTSPPQNKQDLWNSVAKFLESRGMLHEALEVAQDPDYRFDLSVQLGDLDSALGIAHSSDSETKWKQLAELALANGRLEVQGGVFRGGGWGVMGVGCFAVGVGVLWGWGVLRWGWGVLWCICIHHWCVCVNVGDDACVYKPSQHTSLSTHATLSTHNPLTQPLNRLQSSVSYVPRISQACSSSTVPGAAYQA